MKTTGREACDSEPRRTCGPCQVCCHSKAVPAAEAEAWTDCPHQCAAGCAVYRDRPHGCQAYTCAWVDGWGEPADRPDRLGVLFEMAPGPLGGLRVRGVEARPGGAGPAAHARLAQWRELGAQVSLQLYAS